MWRDFYYLKNPEGIIAIRLRTRMPMPGLKSIWSGVGWVTFEPTPPMANAQNYYVSLRETGTGNEGLFRNT